MLRQLILLLTDQLLRAAAIVVTRKLGIKRATNQLRKEPFWKRRMKSKIQVLRGEISRLERSRSNPSLKLRSLTQIRKKYFVKKKGLNVVIEELKQRVTAKEVRTAGTAVQTEPDV